MNRIRVYLTRRMIVYGAVYPIGPDPRGWVSVKRSIHWEHGAPSYLGRTQWDRARGLVFKSLVSLLPATRVSWGDSSFEYDDLGNLTDVRDPQFRRDGTFSANFNAGGPS